MIEGYARCKYVTWPSRVVSLGTSGHSQFQASTLCQNWCFSNSALPVQFNLIFSLQFLECFYGQTCIPVLSLVGEFFSAVWAQELLSRVLVVFLLLLLLVVLVNVLHDLLLGLGHKEALLAGLLVRLLAPHPALVFNSDVFLLGQEVPGLITTLSG